eukprot:TRINITY_DN8088_c0_g1_i5.p2 TRINITY_DN8088_c0_g1~~TRINITY_DN8088_c0_g1_i5.p2  ORF type:complete len:105 (+),score=13.09 TRINITY_DN8088_c0_g1_i5:421-735(+)
MVKAANAGGITAIVALLNAHRDSEDVQQFACGALNTVLRSDPGSDADRYAKCLEVKAEACGIAETVIAALNAHRGSEAVQLHGCGALAYMSGGGGVLVSAEVLR